jgi:hypothetical protein
VRDAVRSCTFREKDKSAKKSLLLGSVRDMLSRRVSAQFFARLHDVVKDPGIEARVLEEWPNDLGGAALAIIEQLRPLEDADPDELGEWLTQRRFLGATIRGTSPMGVKIRTTLGLPPVEKDRRGKPIAGYGWQEEARP